MRSEFPRNSLAGIVLDAEPRLSKPAPRRAFADDSVSAIVLGARHSQSGVFLAASLSLAAALHGGAGFAAIASRNGSNGDAPATAKRTLRIEHVVLLDPPEPPPVPEAPPPAPHKKAAAARARPAPEKAQAPPPPPPAAVGQVVAAEESSSQAAVGFTDFTSGNSPTYVGGLSASPGTSVRAVRGATSANRAAASGRSELSRAHPVGRPSLDWDCPWPSEAAALSITEQFVVLRALVRPDGSVASTSLISDPGHGFGRVALACARKQHFPAATDEAGRAITAQSPPIRVRFSRP
jgi:protein TonB